MRLQVLCRLAIVCVLVCVLHTHTRIYPITQILQCDQDPRHFTIWTSVVGLASKVNHARLCQHFASIAKGVGVGGAVRDFE